MLSTDEIVFTGVSALVESSTKYAPGASLEEGEWFKIENASQQTYMIDIISSNFDTVDFDSLSRSDFQKIDFIFVKSGTTTFFQNVSKSKLVSKKKLGSFGEGYQYQSNCEEIVVNDYPDAIHCGDTDTLYFRKLEPIVGIFKGIAELYREATDEETEQFLQSDFIDLKDDFGTANVKTANRKRIALAMKTLSRLNTSDKENIFTYIGEYCPGLKTEAHAFSVGNEDELKMVLYGIEQRFYTTPVGGEKRIANSVIPMN
jgi:hypothetical protein